MTLLVCICMAITASCESWKILLSIEALENLSLIFFFNISRKKLFEK